MKVIIIGMPRAGTTSIYDLLKNAPEFKHCRFKEPGVFLDFNVHDRKNKLTTHFLDATTDYFFESERVIKNTIEIEELKYVLLERVYDDWKISFLNRCKEFGMSIIDDNTLIYDGLFIRKKVDISKQAINRTVANIKKRIPADRLMVINIFDNPDKIYDLLNWVGLSTNEHIYLKKLNKSSGRLLTADRLAKLRIVRYCASFIPFADVVYKYVRDIQTWFLDRR